MCRNVGFPFVNPTYRSVIALGSGDRTLINQEDSDRTIYSTQARYVSLLKFDNGCIMSKTCKNPNKVKVRSDYLHSALGYVQRSSLIMNKKSKIIFLSYWLLFLGNIFGWHYLYWRGIKSKKFLIYVFFNAIYLTLGYAWNRGSITDVWMKLLIILIYGILFICQVLDINLISSPKSQEGEANENSVEQLEVGEEPSQALEMEAEVICKEECEHTEYEDISHTSTKHKSEPSQIQTKTREAKPQQSLGAEWKKIQRLNGISSDVIQFPTQAKGESQEFSQKEENQQVRVDLDLTLDLLKRANREMTLLEISKETCYEGDMELLKISLDYLGVSGIEKKQNINGEILYFYKSG